MLKLIIRGILSRIGREGLVWKVATSRETYILPQQPPEWVKPKPTFESFVENIASKYRYLEDLPPRIAARKW